MNNDPRTKFEQAAGQQPEGNILRELWEFLQSNKRWWMLPIIIVLLMLGILVFLSGTAAAPFIYTLF